MNEATIHIISDKAASRDNLQNLLSTAGYRSICYTSAEHFLAFADTARGCLIVALQMAKTTGLELQEILGESHRDLALIFVTHSNNTQDAVRAMRRGAIDCLTEPVDPGLLLERVGEVMARFETRHDTAAELAAIRARLGTLTTREHQVMEALVASCSLDQIADQLNISVRAVTLHRAQVMDKMAADSLAALIRQHVRVNEMDSNDTNT